MLILFSAFSQKGRLASKCMYIFEDIVVYQTRRAFWFPQTNNCWFQSVRLEHVLLLRPNTFAVSTSCPADPSSSRLPHFISIHEWQKVAAERGNGREVRRRKKTSIIPFKHTQHAQLPLHHIRKLRPFHAYTPRKSKQRLHLRTDELSDPDLRPRHPSTFLFCGQRF